MATTRAARSAASTATKADQTQHAYERLRKYLSPGTVVYTALNHVSASGMTRDIQVLVAHDSEIIDLSWAAAQAHRSFNLL
jgi:hypothetical protein